MDLGTDEWHRPDWHPDHGDPEIEMGRLQISCRSSSLVQQLQSTTLTLETPSRSKRDAAS